MTSLNLFHYHTNLYFPHTPSHPTQLDSPEPWSAAEQTKSDSESESDTQHRSKSKSYFEPEFEFEFESGSEFQSEPESDFKIRAYQQYRVHSIETSAF